jgi:hypothetical protein
MLQVENPGPTLMSKAHKKLSVGHLSMNDAYESLEEDGRKTDVAL